MEVIVLNHSEEVIELAACRFRNQISCQPDSVLGLATGSTPLNMYKKLVEYHKKQGLDFSRVTTFNLDEYVGLAPEHPGSYSFYMSQNLFSVVGMKKDQYHIPNGLADNIASECDNYENLIEEKGPIDLQLLGIGRDGHIGFNEPGSSLGSRTRLKTLTETTRNDNASTFGGAAAVPLHVMTMGIQTILSSKEIVLIATGQAKAQAVAAMVEGPVTAMVPASALQFHAKTRVILDREAASSLERLTYYQEVFRKKPPWQTSEFI